MRTKKARPNVWENDHCPKYKPKEEGFGSVDDWTKTFRTRMGLDEAESILGNDNPLTILELSVSFTIDDLKRAYRRAAMKWHPDRPDADVAKFKQATAAYVKLGGG